MAPATIRLLVDESLRMFLPARRRSGDFSVEHDGMASLGHMVRSVGVPLTEVGRLLVGVEAVEAVEESYRPLDGDVVHVRPVARPQPAPARYVLDVHLGSLARRMRLLGLDTRYATAADDDELAVVALGEERLLLTKDRGLLLRRALRHQAAYVRGDAADEQVADVLDRFAPPLDPYTRCPACNGVLRPAAKADVVDVLERGTARSYEEFRRCDRCGQVYWRGAHARRLSAVVSGAVERVSGRPRGLLQRSGPTDRPVSRDSSGR